MWIIYIILLITFVWIATLLKSILKGKKRHDSIAKKIEDEILTKMSLPIEEAWKTAEKVLKEKAQCEEWIGRPSQEIMNIVTKLDPSIQKIFEKYKKIWFSESMTLISTEYLLEDRQPVGGYIIGKNNSFGATFMVKRDSPIVYELHGADIRETYTSLIHFIAFIESDLYWD